MTSGNISRGHLALHCLRYEFIGIFAPVNVRLYGLYIRTIKLDSRNGVFEHPGNTNIRK